MTDLLERQLRSSFLRADLPLAPDRLRQVLAELPASTGAARPRPVRLPGLQVAAGLALFAVIGGALAFGLLNRPDQGGPGPSPSPTASTSPTPSGSGTAMRPLVAPAGLLSGYPLAGLAFERSVGPADRPVSDDATITQVDLGPLEYARDIVLAAACLGTGELTVTIRYTTLPSVPDPFVGLVAPCNADVAAVSYSGMPGDQVEIEVISLSVPAGASWRFAIGEIPDPVAPSTFAPITGTAGWWRLWDVQLDSVSPQTGTGVGIRVADDVTRLALWIECSGEESVDLRLVHDQPSVGADVSATIACVPGVPQRTEVPVAAGDTVNVTVTPASAIPVHLYVEADAMPVSEWGVPPNLPTELAHSPFVASSGTYVAVGQLGGSRQTLIRLPGAGPSNRPGGDVVAIPENTSSGATLRLHSVITGEPVATLAEHEAGTFIAGTWVDATHEQVFYSVAQTAGTGLDVFRVTLDGTNLSRVATVPATATSGGLGLAVDNSAFVVDWCDLTACQRTIVEAATLETRQVEFDLDAQLCGGAGSTDGVIALLVAEDCDATGPQQVVVTDLDGNELRRLADPGFVSLLRTTDGPALLVADPAVSGLSVVDVASGSSVPLSVDDALLMPVQGVQLPPDWVLLAPFQGIGDFPIHPSLLIGNPPLLVNVLTSETIEMVNLPH